MTRKLIAVLIGFALGVAPMTPAFSQQKGAGGYKLSDGVVKIGVLTDLSGLY